ncbi:MAG: leucine-rich repeat protein, partial [Prevotella sp.]|nr:leucine-rich repeat protein [Prevotella sp.]
MKTIINRQKSYGGWTLLKTFVLCLFLLFGEMAQILGAESGDIKVDGIYYHISNNGTASVIASLQNSYGGNVVIPESLLYQGEKYIVRGISEKSFYNCRYLTSVSIPSSIKNIGNNAFYNCNALSAVYITDLEAWCNIRFDNSANP